MVRLFWLQHRSRPTDAMLSAVGANDYKTFDLGRYLFFAASAAPPLLHCISVTKRHVLSAQQSLRLRREIREQGRRGFPSWYADHLFSLADKVLVVAWECPASSSLNDVVSEIFLCIITIETPQIKLQSWRFATSWNEPSQGRACKVMD